MLAEVEESPGHIRWLAVRWVDVVLKGHIIERSLSYKVADAEEHYGRPHDEEMDREIQIMMGGYDRIWGGEIFGVAIFQPGYVLDGRCIHAAKIKHCNEVAPASAFYRITRADGTEVLPEPYSCVAGEPPVCHDELKRS